MCGDICKGGGRRGMLTSMEGGGVRKKQGVRLRGEGAGTQCSISITCINVRSINVTHMVDTRGPSGPKNE